MQSLDTVKPLTANCRWTLD